MKGITSNLTKALAITLLLVSATMIGRSQEKPMIDTDALAARGEAIANADELSSELRTQVPDGPGRRGFDIGMAAAEGHTLPGPGKDRIRESLRRDQREGFIIAVSFSLDRNSNKDLAAVGLAIAKGNPVIAAARMAERNALYWLGFDIATGIFGDPALGAKGNTATGPGSLRIRDSLGATAQRGFNAAVKHHLGGQRNKRSSGGPGEYDQSAPATRVGENSAGADTVIRETRPPSTEIRCRGGRDRLIFTAESSRPGSTGETIIVTLLTFEPSPYAAGPRGEGLRPGECSWADRPINGRFLIRFETPANAQLKQKLHGSPVDTSPTAAESYPDARTIPVYMNDPSHYWSFIGGKPVNNFFTATGNGFFRRPSDAGGPTNSHINDRDRVLIPRDPE